MAGSGQSMVPINTGSVAETAVSKLNSNGPYGSNGVSVRSCLPVRWSSPSVSAQMYSLPVDAEAYTR